MDFLGIGIGPVLIILVLLLVFVGPSKLPETARTVGRYARALKKMSTELTEAVSKEIDLDEGARNTSPDAKAAGSQTDLLSTDDKTLPDDLKQGGTQREHATELSLNTGAGYSADAGPGEPKA
jgi:Tat protein translocase TatB subunit